MGGGGGGEGGGGWDLRAEEADVLLQAVLLVAIDMRSGKVISVQSLTLSGLIRTSLEKCTHLYDETHGTINPFTATM